MEKAINLHGHIVVAECGYCGKPIYDKETFYQAPNLQSTNYCSEKCVKMELIREISNPKSNVRSFTNTFQVQSEY